MKNRIKFLEENHTKKLISELTDKFDGVIFIRKNNNKIIACSKGDSSTNIDLMINLASKIHGI